MILQCVFMIFGSMVVARFSRYREYRADAGGAKLGGRDNMIGALEGLKRTLGVTDPHLNDQSVQSFKISSRRSGFLALLSTHPPLEERIRRLKLITD